MKRHKIMSPMLTCARRGRLSAPSGFSQIAKNRARSAANGALRGSDAPLSPRWGTGIRPPPAVALRKYPDGAGLKEITNHGDKN